MKTLADLCKVGQGHHSSMARGYECAIERNTSESQKIYIQSETISYLRVRDDMRKRTCFFTLSYAVVLHHCLSVYVDFSGEICVLSQRELCPGVRASGET